MKTKPNALDMLIDHACLAIGDVGLANLTIGEIAERAGVSTALIHYHFDTKARLLVASAKRIAERRADRRSAALSAGVGMRALDELWDQLLSGVADGLERAWLELVLWAREDAQVAGALAESQPALRHAIIRRLPSLLAELGTTPHTSNEALAAALDAQLDGLTVALLGGQDPAVVRTAYDAFWLTLLAAAPDRR
jgi:TetR/AcrR family transcriptional repressor of bet genes